jgi:hypothetical protein
MYVGPGWVASEIKLCHRMQSVSVASNVNLMLKGSSHDQHLISIRLTVTEPLRSIRRHIRIRPSIIAALHLVANIVTVVVATPLFFAVSYAESPRTKIKHISFYVSLFVQT